MKNYKKEYIDLKKLDELVPSYYRKNINLLFNKNIPAQPKNTNELLIARLANQKETTMQQCFNSMFLIKKSEMETKNEFIKMHFVQNDNGDTAGGQLSQGQRIALYSRKKKEGSKAGFPDISMIVANSQLHLRDTFFCEVKRIGAPSEIHLTREQLDWFLELNGMGFNAYITNNPVFFKNVILKEIEEFLIK